MKITTVAEMRDLDRQAIKEYAIADEILMENAGLAAYQLIHQQLDMRSQTFLVICGIGNNGGDGLVLARKIYSSGADVRVIILGDPDKYRGAAKKNYLTVSQFPIIITSTKSSNKIASAIKNSNVIIDAIFGTGLTRPIEGPFKQIIRLINQSDKTVISLDIPSGINGDTGEVQGIAVKSYATITFGLPKIGNLLYPGFSYNGKLYLSHISFPPPLYQQSFMKIETNSIPELPPRDQEGHKGSFGDTLFISGSANYLGAPHFAAGSFLKAGGGYSRLAAPRSICPFVANQSSEIVFLPQMENSEGSLSLANKKQLLKQSAKSHLVVLGPGLSLNSETQQLIEELIVAIKRPLLIDGDGLTALANNPLLIKSRKYPTILTPHLGELSRITKLSVAEIIKDKINILNHNSKQLNATIIMKGAHTLVASTDGIISINLSGNSGMGSAGSGDVLTGTIAAMYGLGLDINDAARAGVFVHGLSADLAAQEIGEDGITAQTIMDYLPLAMKYYRENFQQIKQTCYNKIHFI